MKIGLRFGKEWKDDILSIPKNEMFTLFKSVCIRLCITEKDLKDTRKQLVETEKELKSLKDEYRGINK